MQKINLLNVEIDNLPTSKLLKELNKGIVFTTNVDHLIKLQKDKEFVEAYNVADYKVCDSQIVMYASKFLGTPIKEKISGSDFFPDFYNYHKTNEDIKIFLLGAGKGIANQAQKNINNKMARNIVVGAHSPSFGFEKDEEECQEIIKMINGTDATVLAVGLGAPKQEKWIYKYRRKLSKIKIFLALGATIDFEAGNLKRSPKWMSSFGLEWFYRLLCEPQRLWQRYLVDDLPFFWLILKQKLNFSNCQNNQTVSMANTKLINSKKEIDIFQFNSTQYKYQNLNSLNRTELKRSAWTKPTSAINLGINFRRSHSYKVEKLNVQTQLTNKFSYR
ncbi:WecB/TagA/CpsF family glycosyltransferase [Gloeocapsopsis crepidinum LEGE 06123]|uniref:WecB/TagA/CpsF family glycosyltransferase n=2 Tax=Gloeocapsopsis crepidinum TaxID=693223 RepID=A0ABR9UVQ8_9CHRO|nr:WecB/TagA/CpsF family glycosyltransferase [Gloeocapsopsis crepidinum]MBE9192366.1 WecB/TagA/CpsF family glycosyltransferase [Gloeocapsopsis crepidinum LEGE 06123]